MAMYQLSLDNFVERNTNTTNEMQEGASKDNYTNLNDNRKKVANANRLDNNYVSLSTWLLREQNSQEYKYLENNITNIDNNSMCRKKRRGDVNSWKGTNKLLTGPVGMYLPLHTYRFEQMFGNCVTQHLLDEHKNNNDRYVPKSDNHIQCKPHLRWSQQIHQQHIEFLQHYYLSHYAEYKFVYTETEPTLEQVPSHNREWVEMEQALNINSNNNNDDDVVVVDVNHANIMASLQQEHYEQSVTHNNELYYDRLQNINHMIADAYNSVLLAVKQNKLEVHSLEELKMSTNCKLSDPLETKMVLEARSTFSNTTNSIEPFVPSFTFGFSATAFLADSLDVICGYQSAPFAHIFDLEMVDEHHAVPRTSFSFTFMSNDNNDNSISNEYYIKPSVSDIVACTSHVAIAALSSGITTWLDERVGKPILCTPLPEELSRLNNTHQAINKSERRRIKSRDEHKMSMSNTCTLANSKVASNNNGFTVIGAGSKRCRGYMEKETNCVSLNRDWTSSNLWCNSTQRQISTEEQEEEEYQWEEETHESDKFTVCNDLTERKEKEYSIESVEMNNLIDNRNDMRSLWEFHNDGCDDSSSSSSNSNNNSNRFSNSNNITNIISHERCNAISNTTKGKFTGLSSICVVRPSSMFEIVTGNKCGDVVLWDVRHTRRPVAVHYSKTEISQLMPQSLHVTMKETTANKTTIVNSLQQQPVVWFTTLSGTLTALSIGASEMSVCVEQKVRHGHCQDRFAHLPPPTPVIDQGMLYCLNYKDNVIDIFDTVMESCEHFSYEKNDSDELFWSNELSQEPLKLKRIASIPQRNNMLAASCCLPVSELDMLVIGNLSGDLTFARTNR